MMIITNGSKRIIWWITCELSWGARCFGVSANCRSTNGHFVVAMRPREHCIFVTDTEHRAWIQFKFSDGESTKAPFRHSPYSCSHKSSSRLLFFTAVRHTLFSCFATTPALLTESLLATGDMSFQSSELPVFLCVITMPRWLLWSELCNRETPRSSWLG